jgi:uncharacterized protein (TIGR03083 family)
MTTRVPSLIAAVRRSSERLRATVEPMTVEHLRGRSYASEWTVADVLSHLGSGAEIGRQVLDAAVEGRPAISRDNFRAIWEVWDAKPPEQQAADSLAADQQLNEALTALETMDAERLAALRAHFGDLQLDADSLVRLRLNEHALHTWDIAVMADPTATVDPAAVTELMTGLDLVVAFAGRPTGERLRVLVRTVDPEYDLVLDTGAEAGSDDGRKVTVGRWDGQEQLPELALPAEAFLRLLAGRLDPDHTPPVQAGVELDDLRAVFPGF